VRRKVDSTQRYEDVPADASRLHKEEEIQLEMQREGLRLMQERRREAEDKREDQHRDARFVRATFVIAATLFLLAGVGLSILLAVSIERGSAELASKAGGGLLACAGGYALVWRSLAKLVARAENSEAGRMTESI